MFRSLTYIDILSIIASVLAICGFGWKILEAIAYLTLPAVTRHNLTLAKVGIKRRIINLKLMRVFWAHPKRLAIRLAHTVILTLIYCTVLLACLGCLALAFLPGDNHSFVKLMAESLLWLLVAFSSLMVMGAKSHVNDLRRPWQYAAAALKNAEATLKIYPQDTELTDFLDQIAQIDREAPWRTEMEPEEHAEYPNRNVAI